jgi:MFS family permease
MNTLLSGLWNRSLDRYPANARRIWDLALTVIATIALYYQSFMLGSVAPLVQAYFHLSLSLYAYSLILGTVLGALAALLGSFSDRIGRANLLVYGLLITGVCTLAMALATSLWPFLFLYWVIGFMDGVMITVTVALVRDFSPRLGRAAAMGFWTVGPVGGSFLATFVASLTLPIYHTWQSQFVIAGSVGLVVFLLCLVGLRELSAGLRDQVMTSLRDKELVEARANHIDVDAVLKHPWHQMLNPRLVISALGIDLLLLMYFVARSFFVIFLSSSFKFPLAQVNGIVSIFWVAIVVSTIMIGFLSDAILVRKAFMLIGTVVLIIATLLFISRLGQPTSTALVTTLLALMGIGISIAYIPWLAAFTETVEDINPALVATGAAVEVFLARWVAIIAILALTLVVGNGQGWGIWLWICVAGQVVFLPTILLVSGHWIPCARSAALAQAQAEPIEVQPHVGFSSRLTHCSAAVRREMFSKSFSFSERLSHSSRSNSSPLPGVYGQ